jgi:hypothetical protein
MRKLFSMMIMLATVSVSAEEVSVTSPDGKLAVNITCNGGHLSYAVSLEGKQMLLPSALGLTTSIGDFTDGLTVKDVKRETVKRHYSMYGTKTTETDYEAGSLLLNCQNVGGQQMAVRFQVSNRDVAFRYELPR